MNNNKRHSFAPGVVVHCRPAPRGTRRVWAVAAVAIAALAAAAVQLAGLL